MRDKIHERFGIKWLNIQSTHDPEIRCLIKFFLENDIKPHYFCGLRTLKEILKSLDPYPIRYIEILDESFTKWWNKKNSLANGSNFNQDLSKHQKPTTTLRKKKTRCWPWNRPNFQFRAKQGQI